MTRFNIQPTANLPKRKIQDRIESNLFSPILPQHLSVNGIFTSYPSSFDQSKLKEIKFEDILIRRNKQSRASPIPVTVRRHMKKSEEI